jgi:hypothetical protein
VNGGHDNSTRHPKKNDCVQAIDFMFSYVDEYMNTKPNGIKHVIMNVYGGESLHHPDIVEILMAVRQKYLRFKDRWHLTLTTTTNAIISNNKLLEILPLIDEFTVSYHTENTKKQKALFRENLLSIKARGRRQKCVVLMHEEPTLFKDAEDMIAWLVQHDIKFLPRQLDRPVHLEDSTGVYDTRQMIWFNKLYNSRNHNAVTELSSTAEESKLTNIGRSCCGGRQVCLDQKYKQRHSFVDNHFPNWYCSVNHFFLYIKQVTGEIFVNKDCKMNFDGSIGPIGHLTESASMIERLRNDLATQTLPVIQCKKSRCLCGLCAPKSKTLEGYHDIMDKYLA